jgi:hypothetical protein
MSICIALINADKILTYILIELDGTQTGFHLPEIIVVRSLENEKENKELFHGYPFLRSEAVNYVYFWH